MKSNSTNPFFASNKFKLSVNLPHTILLEYVLSKKLNKFGVLVLYLIKIKGGIGRGKEGKSKKTAVLLALISICLIAMAGIVAVSVSDEPVADVIYICNSDPE